MDTTMVASVTRQLVGVLSKYVGMSVGVVGWREGATAPSLNEAIV